MEFGKKLKKLRTEKGISQQALADAVYVSRSAVAKWENGLGLPSSDSLESLALFFGVEESFFDTEKPENVIVVKNRHIRLMLAILCAIGAVVLLFVGFLGFRFSKTVKETDIDGIEQQVIAYFGGFADYLGYGEVNDVQIVEIKKRGDYLAVLAKTEKDKWCMCVFDRDRIFSNRWRAGGGNPYYDAGKIVSWNYGSPKGEAVLIFSGGEITEQAQWYTFTNSGIEYFCPIENGTVLDIFVIPDHYNISGAPTLLDEQRNEIISPE